MKKPDRSSGFLLSLLINLALSARWLLASLVLLALWWWAAFPWYLCLIPLGLWLLRGLIVTGLLFWGNKCSVPVTRDKPNKNPYSAKNEDLLPRS